MSTRHGKLLVFAFLTFTVFQNCSQVSFEKVTEAATDSSSLVPVDANGLIRGKVSNALTSAGLYGAQVAIRDVNDPSARVATLFTDASGNYQTPELTPGTYFVDFSLSGFISVSDQQVNVAAGAATVLNQSLTTAVNANQIRIVLNWCDHRAGAVEDVDSYLQVPGDAVPVYFYNKVGTQAQLDIDVLHWQGPETTTITSPMAGTYKFYVNNYSDRDNPYALGQSDVRISVYQGSQLIRTYAISGGYGWTYEVFRIVDGQVVDVQGYNENLAVAEGND